MEPKQGTSLEGPKSGALRGSGALASRSVGAGELDVLIKRPS